MDERFIVQSVLVPGEVCDSEELYIRRYGSAQYVQEGDQIKISAGSSIKTDTYLNAFDAGTWEKYTGISRWLVSFQFRGTGRVRLMHWQAEVRRRVFQEVLHSEGWCGLETEFFHGTGGGLYYLEIEAIAGIEVKEARYEVKKDQAANVSRVRLGIVICTYHRQELLYSNLELLRKSRFFDRGSSLYGKMQVVVVDNASELPAPDTCHMILCHNRNTGGSGGFARGIEELRKNQGEAVPTNVVFMDDDVEFLAETFYRLYALLALLKPEYKCEAVAGRMFRMDERNIQYTAAEIWNKGSIRHIGWNRDMRLAENLPSMNGNKGAEYGGWWFCCFPAEFAMENLPLPFFLHCDDVEYGLRHGGTPLILNGIQVWHETYEYRQDPVMVYYDMRNSMFVNAIICPEDGGDGYIADWKRKISAYHVQKDYVSEYMGIRAMRDFLKGTEWLEGVDPGRLHGVLLRRAKEKGFRVRNLFFWRAVEQLAKWKLGK